MRLRFSPEHRDNNIRAQFVNIDEINFDTLNEVVYWNFTSSSKNQVLDLLR